MAAKDILRKTRREHEITLAQMGEWLGTTSQRVGQWESGDTMPAERISRWTKDSSVPDWVRQMARDLEIAILKQEHAALGERIAQLERTETA